MRLSRVFIAVALMWPVLCGATVSIEPGPRSTGDFSIFSSKARVDAYSTLLNTDASELEEIEEESGRFLDIPSRHAGHALSTYLTALPATVPRSAHLIDRACVFVRAP